ncbi:MAG: thiamine phosphate synthase [Curvibacter sp.]|nr:thiamine phosphate synthase [Curvibacter sp.]
MSTSTTPSLREHALAIVARHQPRFGGHGELPHQAPAGPFAYGAAWLACKALGFIDIDADCLASAWSRRAERCGRNDLLDWPDEPVDFGFNDPAAQAEGFAPCPPSLGLYVVAPSADWVGRLARLGVPTVQLRFKSADPQAVRHEVKAAIEAVRGTDARLFINDHWQIAVEEGAWGVHLGQEDLDVADVEPLRRAGIRLGVSTHGYAEMLRAHRVRPSYIAMGAVYPTTLKAMATAPQGIARLQAYTALMLKLTPPCPLVAIGGIDRDRLPEVLDSGVGSVAVVRAVLAAADPEAEVRHFMAALAERPLQGR